MLLNEHARIVFRTKTTYARCCVDVWIIEKKREKASERARTREREKNKDIKEIHLMLFSPLVYHPLVVLSRFTSYTIHESELLRDFVREKRGKKRERERERKCLKIYTEAIWPNEREEDAQCTTIVPVLFRVHVRDQDVASVEKTVRAVHSHVHQEDRANFQSEGRIRVNPRSSSFYPTSSMRHTQDIIHKIR